MKKILLLLAISFIAEISFAQTPTFCDDMATIFYQNCTGCHRTGNIASFPLVTYADATNAGASIQDAVNNHRMPPWPPNPNFSRLAHERLLSQSDIQKINDWVNGGMPEGNTANLPSLPNYPTGSQIGTPDDVLQSPNYTVTVATDDFRCFVVPSGYSADQMMKAIEFIPGNTAIVHHVLIYWDTTGVCQQLDTQDPNPGYAGFGGVGNDAAQLIGAWVPGATPFILPDGMGINIPANADIVLQYHFAPGSNGQSDSSKINFFYQTGSLIRPVFFDAPLNHVDPTVLTEWPLILPANQVKTCHEHYTLPNFDISMLGVAPHQHLIGKTINAFGVTPANDTIPFISINDWNFHWQGLYQFRKVLKIPANTVLYSVATYDNTTNNYNNPSNPPQLVTAGESTLDEMMLTFFEFTIYFPGDENIVIDNSPLVPLGVNDVTAQNENSNLQLFPNPANDKLITDFTIPATGTYSMEIKDVLGKTVKQLFPSRNMTDGNYRFQYSIGSLPAGNYFVQLTGKTTTISKLIISK